MAKSMAKSMANRWPNRQERQNLSKSMAKSMAKSIHKELLSKKICNRFYSKIIFYTLLLKFCWVVIEKKCISNHNKRKQIDIMNKDDSKIKN